MTILLDNGHGKETPGKRSPIWKDNTQLFEYEFNRDIVKRIAKKLDALNISYKILVPEIEDISLTERCKRANAIYKTDKDIMLISIHANAGGGTGWEVWTSKGFTKSDKYAEIFLDTAKKYFKDVKIRGAKEENFYILRHTECPAILTENFFMDTEKDCKYIMSEKGREEIVNMHVHAILNCIKHENVN